MKYVFIIVVFQCLYSVSRKKLNEFLLTSNYFMLYFFNKIIKCFNSPIQLIQLVFVELEKYPNVKLKFSHKLIDIDFNNSILTFQTLVLRI